jgi:hypothetical protein
MVFLAKSLCPSRVDAAIRLERGTNELAQLHEVDLLFGSTRCIALYFKQSHHNCPTQKWRLLTPMPTLLTFRLLLIGRPRSDSRVENC